MIYKSSTLTKRIKEFKIISAVENVDSFLNFNIHLLISLQSFSFYLKIKSLIFFLKSEHFQIMKFSLVFFPVSKWLKKWSFCCYWYHYLLLTDSGTLIGNWRRFSKNDFQRFMFYYLYFGVVPHASVCFKPDVLRDFIKKQNKFDWFFAFSNKVYQMIEIKIFWLCRDFFLTLKCVANQGIWTCLWL